MSPRCASLCLLVLLGVAFTSGGPCPIPTQTPDNIATVLELKKPEVGGNPLFKSVIDSINTCQRKVHVINVTLDVYTRIFSSILQQHQHQDLTRNPLLGLLSPSDQSQVKSHVEGLLEQAKTMKKNLSRVNQDRDVLGRISRIDVDDPLVQRKALAEFKQVFQALIGCAHGHASPSERR